MKYLTNWQISYQKRVVDASEALNVYLANGDRIFIGTGCGEPQHLLRELRAVLPEYQELEFVQGLSLGLNPVAEQCYERRCRLRSFFVSGETREAIQEGRADYAPVYQSRIPDLFKKGFVPIDLALIQVSPPDQHGFCSLGVSVDIVKAAIKSARTVIAQVNRYMPRVLGDTFVHFSEIDVFVEQDEPLVEMILPTQSAVAERIAGYVIKLIEDGSTIQVGMGRLLNSVLVNLKDKKDLGVHSEFLSDAHLHLVKAGVITGKKKSIHKGKMIASF
ncbi:MAG: acetyl-CoA hydrolase, partial [Deltaproteobacteria bacterium]